VMASFFPSVHKSEMKMVVLDKIFDCYPDDRSIRAGLYTGY